MKTRYYAIFDSKTKAYAANLWPARNDAEAVRSFTDLVRSETKNQVATYPEDFCLYFMFELDDETGIVDPDSRPVPVVQAASLADTAL